MIAPVRLPTVSQEKRVVTVVIGSPNTSAIGPEMMPIGASIADMTK